MSKPYLPDIISKHWNSYANNRKGDWGSYSFVNRNGQAIDIEKDVFYKLLLTGYYEEIPSNGDNIQYKLIKK